MKDNGFKKVKYPTFQSYSIWYVKEKIPYSSAISQKQLIKLFEDFRANKEEKE